jgi:hypothetical protein
MAGTFAYGNPRTHNEIVFTWEIKSCIPIYAQYNIQGLPYAYGDPPVCIRAGTAKIFAYKDPHLHNEIVIIQGVTYTPLVWGIPTRNIHHLTD